MKVETLHDAIQRYGTIDLSTKIWDDKAKWMGLLEIPPTWFPNWKILQSIHPVKVIYCNKDLKDPLFNALRAVHEQGLGHLLNTFDGCFNIRMVRGSKVIPSAHCYGLAIDLNASENKLGQSSGGFYDHLSLVTCFVNEGFDWGGDFASRKDPMHFSRCWE